MFVVTGKYILKPGQREDFLKAIYDQKIIDEFRGEEGNISYDYFFPYEDPDGVFIVERWKDADAWEEHKIAPQTARLQDIKSEYMTGFEPCFQGEIKS